MKSTFKSKINKVLSFLGFNVVKAKRPRKPRASAAKRPPSPNSWDLKEGQTHSYNDGCPGGHLGETGQPNSDNNISGPTS